MKIKQEDDARVVLNQYISYYENQLRTKKRIWNQKKDRWKCDTFGWSKKSFQKKFEIIVGEIIAVNTSIETQNMEVSILHTLLKTFTINKPLYEKLYKMYFKI